VEEQRIVGLSVLNQPAHGADNVVLGGLHDRVRLVISQDNHILTLVVIALREEGSEVVHIVDTPPKLSVLTKVVDADEESLALSRAVGVLEGVALGGTVAELLGRRGRRRTCAGVMSGVARMLERISVSVKSRRRPVLGWRRPVMGAALVTPTTVAGAGTVARITAVAPAGRRRSLMLLVALVSRRALIALVRAPASVMLLGAVVALAGIAASVMGHVYCQCAWIGRVWSGVRETMNKGAGS
jgi:hypothetical protein